MLLNMKTRRLVAGFPRRGYSETRDQMLSAAESIVNNIAEGRAAGSASEFLRFLEMAARSASELSSQVEMAKAYRIVDPKAAFALIGTIICTRRMIRSLQQAIRDTEAERKKSRKRGPAKRRPANQPRKRPPKPPPPPTE